jgi:hypothetical protein
MSLRLTRSLPRIPDRLDRTTSTTTKPRLGFRRAYGLWVVRPLLLPGSSEKPLRVPCSLVCPPGSRRRPFPCCGTRARASQAGRHRNYWPLGCDCTGSRPALARRRLWVGSSAFMAMAQVQVLHDVLQSGIRWRVTLYCDSAAPPLSAKLSALSDRFTRGPTDD